MGMVHFLGVAQLSAAAHIPDGSVTFGATRAIAMAPLDTAKPGSRVADGYKVTAVAGYRTTTTVEPVSGIQDRHATFANALDRTTTTAEPDFRTTTTEEPGNHLANTRTLVALGQTSSSSTPEPRASADLTGTPPPMQIELSLMRSSNVSTTSRSAILTIQLQAERWYSPSGQFPATMAGWMAPSSADCLLKLPSAVDDGSPIIAVVSAECEPSAVPTSIDPRIAGVLVAGISDQAEKWAHWVNVTVLVLEMGPVDRTLLFRTVVLSDVWTEINAVGPTGDHSTDARVVGDAPYFEKKGSDTQQTQLMLYIAIGTLCGALVGLLILTLLKMCVHYCPSHRSRRNRRPAANVSIQRDKKILLATLPIRSFAWHTKNGRIGKEAEPCAICLDDMRHCRRIRRLPCGHMFHPECVDPWLLEKETCPLCVVNVVAAMQSLPNETDRLLLCPSVEST